MPKKEPIIPILQFGIPPLSNPQDIIVYIFRHFVYMPSGVSDTFYSMELSLAHLYAESGHTKEIFERRVVEELTKVFIRIFGTVSVDITAKVGDIDSKDKYSLKIDILLLYNDKMYSIENSVKASKNKSMDTRMTITADGDIIYT